MISTKELDKHKIPSVINDHSIVGIELMRKYVTQQLNMYEM